MDAAKTGKKYVYAKSSIKITRVTSPVNMRVTFLYCMGLFSWVFSAEDAALNTEK